MLDCVVGSIVLIRFVIITDKRVSPIITSGRLTMEPTLIEPLGDSAFLAHFAGEENARAWAAAVRARRSPEIRDVVLAYRSVAVFAETEQVDLGELESRLRAIKSSAESRALGRLLVIPVRYDGADLDVAAARLRLSAAEVIAIHGSVAYDVFAVGFLPGFPYAGYLPPALAGLPRRDSPRLQCAGGLGCHCRPANGDLSLPVARRLAPARDDAALDRPGGNGLLPDPSRRPDPVPGDLGRRIRGPTS